MTGDEKPGGAKADQWRDKFDKGRRESELAIERLRYRAELRSENFEEDTGVIHREALERQKKRDASEPPSSKASPGVVVLTVVRKFPAWGAVLVAIAAIAAWAFLKWSGKL
jgi:hypothetical protein